MAEEGSGESIGRLQVDIVGNLGPLEDHINRALTLLKKVEAQVDRINKKGGVPGAAAPSAGAAPSKGAQGGTAPVNADVKVDAKDVVKNLDAALSGHLFKINIDVPHLQNQLRQALGSNFQFGGGGLGAGSGATPGITQDTKLVIREFSEDLQRRFRTLPGTGGAAIRENPSVIRDLIRQMRGEEPEGLGDPLKELASFVEEFGQDIGTWADQIITKTGAGKDDAAEIKRLLAPIQKLDITRGQVWQDLVTEMRGGLAPAASSAQQAQRDAQTAQRVLNIAEKAFSERPKTAEEPTVAAARVATAQESARANTLDNIKRSIAFATKTSTDELIKGIRESTPLGGEKGKPGTRPTSPEHETSIRVVNEERLRRLMERRSALQETLQPGLSLENEQRTRAEMRRLDNILARAREGFVRRTNQETTVGFGNQRPVLNDDFTPQGADPQRGRRVERRPGAPGGGVDPEADLRAAQQLGDSNRANVRRQRAALRGRFEGVDVNLEPLARFLERGGLRNVIRETKTGNLRELEARGSTPGELLESEANISELRRRVGQRRFTLPGIEGQVEFLKPGAVAEMLAEQLFGEAGTGFLQTPAAQQALGQAIRQGARNKPFDEIGGGASGNARLGGASLQSLAQGRLRVARLVKIVTDIDQGLDDLGEAISSATSDHQLQKLVHRERNLLARRDKFAGFLEEAISTSGARDLTIGEARQLAAASKTERAANRKRIAEGFGLTQLERDLKFENLPETQAANLRSKISQKILPDPRVFIRGVGEARGAGLNPRQIFREMVNQAALKFGLNTVENGRTVRVKGRTEDRKDFETIVKDVARTLFGEQETIFTGRPSATGSTVRRSAGGGELNVRNDLANAAADRAEAGAGRGRVPRRQTGGTRTGASTPGGAAEFIPEFERPSTSLDVEMQQLRPKIEKEAERIARERFEAAKAKRQAEGTFELGESSGTERLRFEDFLRSPAIRGRGGKTIAAGIRPDILKAVESTTDVGKRAAQIRDIQRQADVFLQTLVGTDDINAQRETTRNAKLPDDVRREVIEVLEARTAQAARRPSTRGTREVPTGAETFEVATAALEGRPREQVLNVPPTQTTEAEIARRLINDEPIFAPDRLPPNVPPGGGDEPPTADGGGLGRPSGPNAIPVYVTNVVRVVGIEGAAARAAAGAGGEPVGSPTPGEVPPPATTSPALSQEQRAIREARAAQRRLLSDPKSAFGSSFHPAISHEERQKIFEQVFAGVGELPKIRPVPRVAISAEQRAAEKAEADRFKINFLKEPKAAPFSFVSPEPASLGRQRQAALVAEARKNERVERATRNIDTREQFQDLETEELAQVRGGLRRINRLTPKRGFSASITDAITALVGGGSFQRQLELQSLAEQESASVFSLRGQRSTLRADLDAVRERARQSPAGSSQQVAFLKEGKRLEETIKTYDKAIATSTTRFNNFTKEATAASLVMKSFGAAAVGGAAGAAIGSVTFGLGLAVTGPLIEAVASGVSEVLGPTIEKAFGSPNTTARVTGSLADAFAASGGNRGALFSQLATFPQELISEQLINRAEVEAGNKALKEQLDIVRAMQNLRGQGGAQGFDRGLFQTTGGFFGTPIGGVPSTAEQIGNAVKSPFDEFRAINQRSQQLQPPTDLLERVERIFGIIRLNRPEQLGPPAPGSALDVALQKSSEALDLFNKNAEKAGESLLKLVPGGDIEKFRQLGRESGIPEIEAFVNKLADEGVSLLGAEQSSDILQFLDSVRRGPTILSPEAILRGQERQLRAQAFLRESQFRLSGQNLRAQQGFELGAQPFIAPEAGFTPEDAKAFKTEFAEISSIQTKLTREAATFRKESVGFVTEALGPQRGQEFADSLKAVEQIGSRIADIQIGVQTAQAALAAKQYSVQLGVARRNLQDALALQGKIVGGSENLGKIEREQFQLQREAQSLQLGMSQRQINFQKAIAGITAPGLTGEERAARIEQAKIEAEFAQKQLDIQKQLFGLSGKQFQITADRAVTDLVNQIGLLSQGREVVLKTAAAEKQIAALTKLQERENKKIQLYYQEAINRTVDVMELQAQLITATGRGLVDIRDKVLESFRVAYRGMIGEINASLRVGGGGGGAGGTAPKLLASGALFQTTGPTSMIVGEAGTETVAVLRNPRSVTSSFNGGGGGPAIQIYVSGNTFSNEEQMERLKRDITDAVERGLGRRATLLGASIP